MDNINKIVNPYSFVKHGDVITNNHKKKTMDNINKIVNPYSFVKHGELECVRKF